jgi:hypothetical protein
MKVEVWKSDQNREEIHYFEDDGETYLFGYNPRLIPKEIMDYVLEFVDAL